MVLLTPSQAPAPPVPPKTTRIAAMKPKGKSKPAKQREEVKERIRQSQKARKVNQKPPTSKTVWIGDVRPIFYFADSSHSLFQQLRADVTDNHLLRAFALCGRISEVTIRVARGSAMLPEEGSTVLDDYSQLYASMTFYDAISTRAALEMDGQELLGRRMKVRALHDLLVQHPHVHQIRGDAWSLMAIEEPEPEPTHSPVEKGWNQIKCVYKQAGWFFVLTGSCLRRWTTERTEPNISLATPKRKGRAGPSTRSPSSPLEFLKRLKLPMLNRALPPTDD